jgi:multidrug resistance efflux pump
MSAKDSIEVLVPLKSWEDAVTEAQSLEVRLAHAEAKIAEATARADKAERDLRHMHDTLTAAQKRSTECLTIARAVKAIGDDDVMQRLAPLGARIVSQRACFYPANLHRLLGDLADVVVAHAAPHGTEKRAERIEIALVDLAATAMRIVLGDHV